MMFGKKQMNETHQIVLEQIADVEACVHALEDFIRFACTTNDSVPLRSLAKKVADAEAQADESLRRMIDSLAESNFLPATREDLISMATSCDQIANKCETFAVRVVQQKFKLPAEFDQDLLKIMQITYEQFDLLKTATGSLFSNFRAMLKDHSILTAISACESQVDEIEGAICEKLYDMDDLELARKMQIASFIELVCDLSDNIEDIADKIQVLLVTRKA